MSEAFKRTFDGVEVREDPQRPGYWVSADGRVAGPRGHWLRTTVQHGGYVLYGNRKRAVHRAVLEAWIGPCPPGLEALHGPGGKADNSVGNLRWGTRSENCEELVADGNHVQARKTHCPEGHGYTKENTYVHEASDGSVERHCRKCRAAASRRYKEGKRVRHA